MKIIYFTSIYYPYIGGLQKVIYDLADNMKKRGHHVEIITGDIHIKQITSESINNIVVYRIPIKNRLGLPVLQKKSDRKTIRALVKNADVIHNNDIKFMPLFHYSVQKKYKAKYFLSSHGFIFHTSKYLVFKKIYMILFSILCKLYDGVFCVSKQDLNIAQNYNFTNCFYVPAAVDITKFKSVKNTHIKEGRLFYYGRISQNKGIENALNKFASLPREFTFIIAGTGDIVYMQKLISIGEQWEVNKKNNLSFVGEVSEDMLIQYFEEVEFIILPSLHEGFGLTLIESLAANKKVIAHTNESYRDILLDLKLEHYLFDFSDSCSSLLNKITELRALPIKEINLTEYTVDTMCDTISNLYYR